MDKMGPRWFYDHVVLALGELSDFEAGVGVPRVNVVTRVLDNTGIDKMAKGTSPSRKDGKPQVILWIDHAFRNQRPKYKKKKPRCQQIDAEEAKGLWGLTEDGVKRALELTESTPSGGSGGGNGGGGGGKAPVVEPDSIEEEDAPIAEEIVDEDVSDSLVDDQVEEAAPVLTPAPVYSSPDPSDLLTFKGRGYQATAHVCGNSFIVLQGSIMRTRAVASLGKTRLRIRKGLIDQGVVQETETGFEFTRDYDFRTSSDAACIVSGIRYSGLMAWKKDGKCLKRGMNLPDGRKKTFTLASLLSDIRSEIENVVSDEVVQVVAEEIVEELSQEDIVCEVEKTLQVVEEPEVEADPETNLTGQFLGDNWDECWNTLLAAVRKHWKRSDELGLAEDHVSTYITSLINRDGLRRYLLDPNYKLSVRHLANWCVKDCISQQHQWGCDPSARTLRGARTRLDRSGEIDARIDPDLSGRFVWNEGRSFEIVDNAHEDIIDQLSFQEALGKMEAIIHKNMKAAAAERYCSVLRSMVEDECSIVDVAKQEQVTRHRAASIVGTLRSLMRGAERVGYLEGYIN